MKPQQPPHRRIAHRNAQHHRALRELIGDRVENLAEIGHHVILARDAPVEDMAQAADGKRYKRRGELLVHIQHDENRYKQQAEIAQKVRYRKRFLAYLFTYVSLILFV